jgi:hypothetical protein
VEETGGMNQGQEEEGDGVCKGEGSFGGSRCVGG